VNTTVDNDCQFKLDAIRWTHVAYVAVDHKGAEVIGNKPVHSLIIIVC